MNYFFKYDEKNGTLFFKYDAKKCTFFKKTQRIELSFFFWLWLTELIFFEYDSQNWTFFPFLWIWPKNWTPFFLTMTHRIEPFNFWIGLTELNLPFFTQRIEPFFLFENHSKNWIFFFRDSKNWTFFQYDSQNGTFFNTNQRIELLFFWNTTHRNGLISWIWRKELDSYFLNMTQGIEPFNFWKLLTELNLLFSWLKELNFVSYDSKNWTFFQFRLTELNLFLNMTHVIEPFLWKWLQDLNLFLIRLEELNLFLISLKEFIFLIRLTELNPFF